MDSEQGLPSSPAGEAANFYRFEHFWVRYLQIHSNYIPMIPFVVKYLMIDFKIVDIGKRTKILDIKLMFD